MAATRRDFLSSTIALFVGAGALPATASTSTSGGAPSPGPAAAAASPSTAAGAIAAAAPDVTPATFAEAARLFQVELTPAERALAAANWNAAVAPLFERRVGPRRVSLDAALAPASAWNPELPGHAAGARADRFVRSERDPGPVPADETDLAYSPVWKLSRWIERGRLRSTDLTEVYLRRLERHGPRLNCVVTPTPALAREQARRADAELAAGRRRGPLHGIPWGAKDILDTAGIPTTWGAEPYVDRVPTRDAAVVRRLHEAGAVLVAKLSTGALAMGDVWHGGQTLNPWLTDEGSSGSSAGAGAATAAGLVAFAIGSETLGSIVSPSMRCGLTGLRPTYGRVARTGAMTLCWSLDKLGPMTRSVEDAMLVLHAIAGPDAGDAASVARPLDYDARADLGGLRVGYVPAWLEAAPANEIDREALRQLGALGVQTVAVEMPDLPYASLIPILLAEAAAAFETLTLERGVDRLRLQSADAWPNVFRQARFISAVDFVQADRLRRLVAQRMDESYAGVDAMLVPSLREEMLVAGNYTGHPSLTLRAGFTTLAAPRSDFAPPPDAPPRTFDPPRRVPHGVTLVGRLHGEGTLARLGLALEQALGVADARPPEFA